MKQLFSTASAAGLFLAAAVLPVAAFAQDASSPLRDGAYIAPLASYVWTDDDKMDDGYGGSLGFGYRQDWYAIELSGLYQSLSGSTKLSGGNVNALLFPTKSLPGLYLLIGAGGMQIKDYPTGGNSTQFSNTFANVGPGYLFPLKLGNYEFAVRAEALYRYGRRDSSPAGTTMAPDNFNYALFNLGFQLPLSRAASPAPIVSEPVTVVPLAAPSDSDGDGVMDDHDQCPATPADTKVNDVGCALPPPPCKAPDAGQKVDLAGCAAGDTIVLHGVNFEFDQAKLTINAKAILDSVADSLTTASDLSFEIGGHTDSRGSDAYNEALSTRRAQAVADYLQQRGIAADRMTVTGYGETEPVADNDTDEGRELNRRVELKITNGGIDAAISANAPADHDSAPAEVAPDTSTAPEISPTGDDNSPPDVAPVQAEVLPPTTLQ